MTKMGKKQICAKNYNERVALARTTSVQGVMLRLKGLLREARLAPPPAATRDISRLLSQRQRLRQRRHRNRLAVSLPPVICCNLSDLELQFIVACWKPEPDQNFPSATSLVASSIPFSLNHLHLHRKITTTTSSPPRMRPQDMRI